MPRFFVDPRQIEDGVVRIAGEDTNHITRVLRLRPGDRITVLDGTGLEYEVVISTISEEEVTGRVVGSRQRRTEPRLKVTLVQGLPKADKMELIIQKCTEIGVARILPARTERSVVELEGGKAARRLERWRKIAVQAAEQSGRALVPAIGEVTPLAAVLNSAEFHDAMENGLGLALMPWEGEDSVDLRRALAGRLLQAPSMMGQDGQGGGPVGQGDRDVTLAQYSRRPEVAWLFIGPEGGFSAREVEMAHAAGVNTITLGPRILRTETAGFVALTLLLWEAGELDVDASEKGKST
ncbi:MAG: 16S rRNA (uracil(1498)-N(3))-methyltransferase [Firmicutes bacterium]|nr:16S rRNA (uracil(1498)-N(3))-methyltransferase [Bacillota bacterium]